MSFHYDELCSNAQTNGMAMGGTLKRSDFDDSAVVMIARGQNLAGVSLGLLLICILVVSFWYYNKTWSKRNEMLEEATGVMRDTTTYALKLVADFMPSWNLEKYQFRGMQKKAKGVTIAFEDLSLTLKTSGKKKVLNGVTGEFESGRMCAIMGPSGAGKTTFMNVLCGKATYGDMGGTIKINGTPAHVADIKSVMGFVPQDDIVHEHLTVREQVQFSARLRNKAGTQPKSIENITNDVLNVMQVVDIQNSIVGGVEKRGISGGQRKRVNIGLELAAQPTLLFLDEPTSGLDSSSSVAVCASLKKMTQLGMTSVMVIHQPRFSLFTLFDDVLLLGKGGHTVYLGPSTACKAYFESSGFRMPENENPADWFMDIIAGELHKDAPTPEGFKPSMLFDMWKNRSAAITDMMLSSFTCAGRDIDHGDDIVVLSGKLEEQWDRIDINKDGVMEPDELKQLLARCAGQVPPDEVVQELFQRMAGRNAEAVTKVQFVEYLSGLRGVVSNDRTMQELREQLPLDTVTEEPSTDGDGESASTQDSDDLEENAGCARPPDTHRSDFSLKQLNRRLPGFVPQFRVLLRRQTCAWWRGSRTRCIFLVALAAGALVLGLQDNLVTHTPQWQAMGILNVHTALALLISIFSLGLFGSDRPVFWRESSNGLKISAHFIARVLTNWVDLVIFTYVFSGIYFFICTVTAGDEESAINYSDFAWPYFLITFVASGWGYFISAVVPPQHGSFIVSLCIFVACGLLGNPANLSQYLIGGTLETVVDLVSITRWSVDVSFLTYLEKAKPIPEGALETQMFCLAQGMFAEGKTAGRSWGVAALLAQGVLLHVLAFLGIRFLNRDKQV